jgi:putative hydrolase of the HAD superfamily
MANNLVPPPTRAVVFDAVGTLIFPAPGAPAVYAAFAARHGVRCDAGIIRGRMIAAYAAEENADRSAGWLTSESREVERWRRIVAASLPDLEDPEACFRELFEHFAKPEAWTVNPDAGDVFTALLARGIVIALASNYDERLRRMMAGRPELDPLAERVIISSEIGHRKPSSRFFEAVLGAVGDEPDGVVYVGDDHENDYRGALGAGLRAVLFDDQDRFPEAVRIRRLAELVE